MSQPDLLAAEPQPQEQDDEVVEVKPRFSVYTMMLLLSLFAIITACVLLYLEMDSYKPDKGGGSGWPWETQGAWRLDHDSTGTPGSALV